MDGIFTTIIMALVALAAYLFKDIQLKKVKAERDILDLELQKSAKKQKLREAAIRTQTARITYEKAKDKFMSDYGSLINGDNRNGSNSNSDGDSN